jgi:hypothetical protein
MDSKSNYHPFQSSIALPKKRSSLPTRLKTSLVEHSKTWRDNTKIKRGASVPLAGLFWGSYSIKLSHSIIKIDGDLYEIMEELDHGGMGKIAVLKKVSDGSLILAKVFIGETEINKTNEYLNELGLIADAGLSRGKTSRVWRDKDEKTGVYTGPYFLKHYILMPYLV